MTRLRRKTEEALWLLGLHQFGRSLNSALHPGKGKRRRRMLAFYGELLPPNSLVFDVGANLGNFSSVFTSLGHRVVAIEPNLDCIRHIEITYGSLPITLIHAVLGPAKGLAMLNVSDRRDDLSSMCDTWIPKELDSRKAPVAMLTLDDLVSQFGRPDFIKIDVEGFEESVLDGLTGPPPSLLSFEFNSEHLDAAFRCLEKKHFSAAEFNYAMEDPQAFELPDWVEVEEIKTALARVRGYGDVFAKIHRQKQAG